MGFLANLLVKIGVDNRELNAGMDKATRSVNKFAQDVESAGRRMTLGITLPIAGLAAASLKASADMESLRMGLTAITHSSSETEKQMSRLKEVAKIPGLDFQGAVKGSINLQAAGFSATTAERALRAFGNALATVGKGREDLDGVNLVLTQILNKPKVMAQDLNQLRERLPQISQAMKAAFGTNVSEDLQALGITGEQFVNKIIAEFEKLPPVTSGLKNSFENLRDNAFQALAKIGDGLAPIAQRVINDVLSPMASKVKELADEFGKLPKPVQNTILGVGGAAAAFPLLTIAMGATITNAIAIGSAFMKMVPLIGKAAAALELWIAGMGAASVSWGTMVATGMLRASVYVAAAVAVVQLANAWWEYAKAKEAASQAEKTQQQKLLELEVSLKRQGADISGIQKQYSQGEISLTQYLQRLRDVAIELGKSKKAHDDHKNSAKGTGDAAQQAGSFFIFEAVSAEQASDAVGRAKDTVRKYADALGGLKEYGAEVWSDMSGRVLDFSVLAEAAGPLVAQMVEVPAKTFDQALNPAIREAEAAMHSLGIASTRELRAAYDAALAAARAMVKAGAGVADVGAAMEVAAEAHKKLSQRTGEWDGQLGKTAKTASLYSRQVSTAVNDVARSIADVITLQKRWGDAAKDLGKSFVRIIAEDFINAGFGKLVKFIASEVLPHLGKVGKAIAGIIGGGASGAAGAAGGAASAAGGAASAAGSAGSGAAGAASGLMGTIGAVGAAVGAVSSVVGNFQMAGMNKSLDVLVNHTLRTANDLANLRADEWTREGHLMLKLDDMWNEIRNVVSAVGGGTGGRGGLTVNINGGNWMGTPEQVASAIFTQAQLAGAI